MKTLILTIAMALTLSLTVRTASAYENRNDYRSYPGERREALDRQVDHLNRMLERVRWQTTHYRADWQVRRDLQSVSREVDRLNHRFRSGEFDRSRMRRDIDRLHDRLHGIEQRLQVRSRDLYHWD